MTAMEAGAGDQEDRLKPVTVLTATDLGDVDVLVGVKPFVMW